MSIRRVLEFGILLGALAGLAVGYQRWQLERSYRTVELTIEWPEMRSLAGMLRVPMTRLLLEAKNAGVTSVAIQEQTVRQLVDDGQVFRPDPFTDARVQALIGGAGERTVRHVVFGFPDNALRARVESNLSELWGQDRIHEASLDAMPALVVDGGYAQFRDLGVGLDPVARAEIRSAGLLVVGRVKNYAALDADHLRSLLQQTRDAGASTVIFNGDDVLGNPNLIPVTADVLRQVGMSYGAVEFGKQHGDDKLQQALEGQFIRVHTIQGAEFSNMTPGSAVARFVKAVRERNIRLCYIHTPSSVTGGTLQGDVDFIHQIATGIESAGYQLGSARPAPEWHAPKIARILASVGVVSAIMLLALMLLGELPAWFLAGCGVLLAGLVVGSGKVLVDEAGALLAALVFPTIALCQASVLTTQGEPDLKSTGHRRAAGQAFRLTVLVCLLSMLGALCIITFLGDTVFMTHTNQFVGIKPSITLPILGVAVILWGGLLEPGTPQRRWQNMVNRARRTLEEPLQIWHLVAIILAGMAFMVLVARSGNDSTVGATVLELKTRRILDGWLVARPRTKEFMIGHPALYLAFYAASRRWRLWVMPLLMIAAVGQTSLVNTFCHIHTPLYIAVFHALNGLWMGMLLGWILSVVADRIHRRFRTETLIVPNGNKP